ncbi:MAG: hypothetical protein CMI09_09375 [Oceanospirillaceae bacterium]|nr:hypothetical protein [Oceanospirillaceae bacterium]|tara:strand:- start:50 stop:295 length:246 start_codon:yes stop_codon:yes gene_type:complete
MSERYDKKSVEPMASLKSIDEGSATVVAIRKRGGECEGSVCWVAPGGEFIYREVEAQALARRMARLIHLNGSDRAFRGFPK